jgi:hypothetical protein
MPVVQGNNREYHAFWTIFWLGAPDKTAEMLGFFTKFPGEWNRELFSLLREFQKGIREFSERSREKLISLAMGLISHFPLAPVSRARTA